LQAGNDSIPDAQLIASVNFGVDPKTNPGYSNFGLHRFADDIFYMSSRIMK
jgi:hypothetical protein